MPHRRTRVEPPGARAYNQTRAGGADTGDIPGWAIEVKRQEVLNTDAWWKQAVKQAEDSNRKPILFYRRSRQPWRAVVSARDFMDVYLEINSVRPWVPGVVTLDLPLAIDLLVRSMNVRLWNENTAEKP